MRKTTITCDACGKEISGKERKTYQEINPSDLDLCSDCLRLLLKYAIKKTHFMKDCKECKGTGKVRVEINDGGCPGPHDSPEYKLVPCRKCQGWRNEENVS